MNDEIPASDVTIDTGPLKWDAVRHTRGQWIASLAVVVCSLAILGMVIGYALWGRP